MELRGLDDDPRVHPVLLDEARMADAPDAIPVLRQPLEAVIGLERIAAVADEAEHAREGVVGQRRIGQRAAYLVAQDRKSVVSGKSVSVRVDLGGRRIIKQTKNKSKTPLHKIKQTLSTK